MAAGTEITQAVDVMTAINARLKDTLFVDMTLNRSEGSSEVSPTTNQVAFTEAVDTKVQGDTAVEVCGLEQKPISPNSNRLGRPPRFESKCVHMSKSFSASKLMTRDTQSEGTLESNQCNSMSVVVESVEYAPSLRSGGCSDIGPRRHMEDVHVLIDDIRSRFQAATLAMPRAFYGVFDGHHGKGAASFVSEHLLRHVVEDAAFPDEMSAVLQRAFLRTDMDFEAAYVAGHEPGSGTTALTVFISGSSLVVANVGDCRAVLSRAGKAVELSRDQKPGSPLERARIEAAGGFCVCVDGSEYLNGHLSVARALGDWHIEGLKVWDPCLNTLGPLISEPEVQEATLTPEDEFLILGCDGLWDVLSSQDAVEFARSMLQQHNDPEQCSRDLVQEALRRNTTDNLTVVLVCFGADPPPRRRPTAWNAQFKKSISVDGLLTLQSLLNG